MSANKSTSENKRSSKLKIVKILDQHTAEKYQPLAEKRVIPKVWELSTRKTFFNWVIDTFQTYSADRQKQNKSESQPIKMDLFVQQKLVRDFISDQSPYRGLLLYHGLGVGKTCAAIAISKTIVDPKKEVWVFSKASLEGNFIKNVKDCGMDMVRNQNHWVFMECYSPYERKLATQDYQIPAEVINRNNGAFIIDYSNDEPNYNTLSPMQQSKLDYQINAILDKRFKFKHLDDTRLLQKLEQDGKYPFDNKILIFDEVHNLINGIATGSKTGVQFEKHLMAAKNSKIIFLTGTPLINDVFESAKIFNILRGPITTYSYRVISLEDEVNWKLVHSTLKRNIYIDQIIIQASQKLVKVTQNPDNYINDPNGKGIIHQPGRVLNGERFQDLVKKQLIGLGYQVIASKDINTALPNDQKDFDALFYNRDLNRLKKTDIIRNRIMGLTSFYDPAVKNLMPEVTKVEKVFVEMSDLQSHQYQTMRNKEIEKNKSMMKKPGRDADKIKTSYRIFSRMHCTFAFPEELGSPYDKENGTILDKVDEDLSVLESDMESEENQQKIAKLDMILKKTYLKALEQDKEKYLGIENGSLAKHSPKYLKMIENIERSPGNVFVYSQFITLIGLNTFCIALEATGKYTNFEIKKVDGNWVLDNKPSDDHKFKYIIWAGEIKDKEKRDILIKVFNNELDLLPSSCQLLKKQIKKQFGEELNKRGKIAKIFLTTKTGAEGISLFNVRQVHVMEPYWQPVLIDQVVGRAVRTGSHLTLPPADRNVEVYVYIATYSPEQLRLLRNPNLRSDVARFNDGLQKRGQIVTSDESLYIISERKRNVINVLLKIIKETAFDCNIHAASNFNVDDPYKCLDYDSKNRDDYLSAPGIMDTVGLVEEHQEHHVKIAMGEFKIKGVKYYYEMNVAPGQKRYIYNDNIMKAGRTKPVGELIERNGQTLPALYKKKVKKVKKQVSKKSKIKTRSSKTSNTSNITLGKNKKTHTQPKTTRRTTKK
uniref:Helicase C-terminal domain-containing protein n=1 Tax=viral metagenome TaxID=1070528 RepID=A0A6C0EC36_9ZZZZ